MRRPDLLVSSRSARDETSSKQTTRKPSLFILVSDAFYFFVFWGFVLSLRRGLVVEAGLDLLIVLFLFLECCGRRHPLPRQLVSAFENTFMFPNEEMYLLYTSFQCVLLNASFLSF